MSVRVVTDQGNRLSTLFLMALTDGKLETNPLITDLAGVVE